METKAITAQSETATVAPVVIDLGKTKTKRVKDLKRGSGKLIDEVQYATNQVIASLGDNAKGKVFVPVVMVYRKKRRRRNPFGL